MSINNGFSFIKRFIAKVLLVCTIIGLVITGIMILNYVAEPETREKMQSAIFGMLMITSFFAVPYIIFFRKSKKNQAHSLLTQPKKPKKGDLRRCQTCSSTDLVEKEGSIVCNYCGSTYDYK